MYIFQATDSVSPFWKSNNLSGSIGLAPYWSAPANMRNYNFLYQLKINKIINQTIFSIPKDLKSILFGSWDYNQAAGLDRKNYL